MRLTGENTSVCLVLLRYVSRRAVGIAAAVEITSLGWRQNILANGPAMSTDPHILLVEDDSEISTLLARTLAENGLQVTCVASGTDMDQALLDGNVALVVLDVMLPGESGFSICGRLRASGTIPIIMLTALGENLDRVLGLEIGADDYAQADRIALTWVGQKLWA